MRITSREPEAPVRRPGRFRSRPGLWIALAAVVLAGWSAGVFAAGIGYFKVILPQLRDFTGAPTPGGAIRSIVRSPGNWLVALASDEELAHLDIDLKFKDLRKLQEKRAEADMKNADTNAVALELIKEMVEMMVDADMERLEKAK